MSERASPRSILAADIGTAFTHVALIERVAGVYRLAACIDTPSLGNDEVDLRASLCRALDDLQAIAQRPLLDGDDVPILPRQGEAGCDLLVVSSSAGGRLHSALIGLTDDLSLAPGRAACSLTGTLLTDEIVLAAERPVRHRALAGLRASPPDVIVMLGGTDGGPVRPFASAASVLATLFADVPMDERPVVVFAGNLEARRPVADALGPGFDYRVVENAQPRLGQHNPQELQRELARIHAERRLARTPGFAELSAWAAVPIISSDAGTNIVLQFLSRRDRGSRHVLGVDVGGSHTWAALTVDRPPALQVSGPGTTASLHHLPESVELNRIARWLPSRALADAAPAMLLNRALRPRTWPERREESMLLLAAAREALRSPLQALEQLADGTLATADLVALRGGAFSHAGEDALALLAALDALQPRGLTRFVLDWASIWPALGALAQCEPLAALQVLERDALRDLGPVFSVDGQGAPGQPALQIRLDQAGDIMEGQLCWGSISCMPLLPAGGRLSVAPLRETLLGQHRPGTPVQLDVAGGSLGLVVDCRGRPLVLSDDDARRCRELEVWQSAIC